MSVNAICNKQSLASLIEEDYEAAKILNEIKMMSDRNAPSPIVEKTIKKRKEIPHSQLKTVESTIKLKDSVFARFYPCGSIVRYKGKDVEIVSVPKDEKIDIKFKHGEVSSISVADLKPKIGKNERVLFLDSKDPNLRYSTAIIKKTNRGHIRAVWESFRQICIYAPRNFNTITAIIPISKTEQLRELHSEEVEFGTNGKQKCLRTMYDLLEREAPAKRYKVSNISSIDLTKE